VRCLPDNLQALRCALSPQEVMIDQSGFGRKVRSTQESETKEAGQ
jgi:hypothetical protein